MTAYRQLRIVLIAGTLGQGGAEKQLVYIASSLQQLGVQLRIYCLTKGDFYETRLKDLNLSPIFIGKFHSPVLRTVKLLISMFGFRPHIIYSTHFYSNLYAAIAGFIYHALSIGSVRNDTISEVKNNGIWGKKLLQMPKTIIANSVNGKQNAISLGAKADRIFVLPNALDLDSFDTLYKLPTTLPSHINRKKSQIIAVAIGSLVSAKRFDRFLEALKKARMRVPYLEGFIIGDGAERNRLEQIATQIGLMPDGVHFLGRVNNIPGILKYANIFVLTSDYEGMPNVILEAMAASLAVITTPAGDASVAVEHNVTGFVVPFDEIDMLADYLVQLSISRELQKSFGEAGRKRVEKYYDFNLLGQRLVDIFSEMAITFNIPKVIKAIRFSLTEDENG